MFEFTPPRLRHGCGNGDPRNGFCLMQMVGWFAGENCPSDKQFCASPSLNCFAVYVNDAARNQKERDKLWPLVWQLLNSVDDEAERKRAEHIVREVAHRLVAPLFVEIDPNISRELKLAHSMKDIWMVAIAAKEAATLPMINSLVPAEAEAIEIATRELYYGMDVMPAVRTAMEAATVAPEAKVREYTNVAAYFQTRKEMWEISREILVGAIALGRHGDEDPVFIPRIEALHRAL